MRFGADQLVCQLLMNFNISYDDALNMPYERAIYFLTLKKEMIDYNTPK